MSPRVTAAYFRGTDSSSHGLLWTGVTRGADRAVSATTPPPTSSPPPPSPKERACRVAGDSAKSQHSLRRLVPSALSFYFLFFETVPMEAGLSPCSWNFYRLSLRGQEEEDRVGILQEEFAASPTCREAPLGFALAFCFCFFPSMPARTRLTSRDDVGTVRIQSAFEIVIKKKKKTEEPVTSHRELSWILPEEIYLWANATDMHKN